MRQPAGALLAGGLMAAAFSPWMAAAATLLPGLAALASIAIFLGVLRGVGTARGALLAGAAFGSVWLVGATGWMFVSLHRYGGMPAWLAGGAVAALCVALSGFMALAALCFFRWRRGGVWADALLWASLWLLAEWARGTIFTGFPWAASGYALVDTPLAAAAPLTGVYLLGAVGAFLAALPALASRPRDRAIAGALLGAVFLGGWAADRLSWNEFSADTGRPLSVTLLQGNIAQGEKFEQRALGGQLVWHAQMLRAANTDLVVAPETAIPLLPTQLPAGFWEALAAPFFTSSRAALLGIPLGDFDRGYTNSVVGFSSAAKNLPEGFYRYNKHHLVPFGEFIPPGFRWFVDMMKMPLGDFARGPANAASFALGGQQVAPTICYEDLFGEELAARFITPDQPAPTLFANVSNLAWFGETVAIHQHLQIARMRSLEFQRPTVRATNTGATVVIDHKGRVVEALPPNTRGALVARVQGRRGNTPFARWAGRWGQWPAALVSCVVIAGVAAWPRREGRSSASL